MDFFFSTIALTRFELSISVNLTEDIIMYSFLYSTRMYTMFLLSGSPHIVLTDNVIYVFQMPKFYSTCSVLFLCFIWVHLRSSLSSFLLLYLSLPLSSPLSLILRHATKIHLPKCWLVRLLLTKTPVSTDAVSSKYKLKSFPTAGSNPGSFQSKSEHASQTAMMNPQIIREKNLDK